MNMLILKHQKWEKYFTLNCDKLSILVVEKPQLLWEYCIMLQNQARGDDGDFLLLNNDYKTQSIEKLCNVELSIAGLTLNTKKLQTALIKKCAENAQGVDFEYQFRKLSDNLYDFCKNVAQSCGFSIILDEDMDVAALLKMYSLSLKDSFPSLVVKLIEYINVSVEFTKSRVFIFLFLSKFLIKEEIEQLFKHCKYQEVSIVLVEAEYPNMLKTSNIPHQSIIIDNDEFEITKNI